MLDFQREKNTVLGYYADLDAAEGQGITDVLNAHTTADYTWRAFHPFHLQSDVETVSELFWQPFKQALTHSQRRMDVFFAGQNFMDDGASTWVCSMGHLMGLFDSPWLGIKPTGKMTMLRYAEFHKIEESKIAETAFYFDIPHFMAQAGVNPFPHQSAAQLVQPGPTTHDALLFADADPVDGQKTMDAMNFMISDLGQWQSELPLEEELARSWHDDMIWWGPTGIGATFTIARYARQHSGPFRAGLSDRSGTGHIARIAEGAFSGFFGWPNFTARNTGGYLGLPPNDKECEFRVIDIYRREGDKLKENWVFIDMLHFFMQQGVDILERARAT
ncbi:MAG: ester cyclase [Litoreibacter sp.]|uniref:ester cyclase n=1 Tax=Litoreibacter sp. TaxID=1969459 RepID=UPI003297B6CD